MRRVDPVIKVAKILNVIIDPVTDSPYGQIKGGELQLRGRLAKVVLHRDKKIEIACGRDRLLLPNLRSGLQILWDEPYDYMQYPSYLEGATLYLLPLLQDGPYSAERFMNKYQRLDGIVIQPSVSQPGRFKRCGNFYSTWQPMTDFIWCGSDYFDAISADCGLDLEISELNGEKAYIINII